MSEIKPCPFCGGEDVSVDAGYWDTHGARYEIGCENPQCEVHPCSDLFPTEAEAIEAWNTRAERTCHAIDKGDCLDGSDCPAWECSECGGLFEVYANYCTNCGRKVVSE